jgi:DMSO/TMAO reductase YedYZ molybdopterin-dependent catalytic subunit
MERPDTVTERPWNAETPRSALQDPLTPNDRFFVRNHFDMPVLDPQRYLLSVGGLVRREQGFTLDQLRRLPQRRVTAVLECAGNGRSRMMPRPPGLPWGDGAVGCSTWEGPALRDLLAEVEPSPEAVEALFGGSDVGADEGRLMRFERSLSLAEATREDVIVALRMNGQELSREHGAPARLIVPGWYAVASVKWLVSVRLLNRSFAGWFQGDRYVWDDGSPLTALRPKTLILRPIDGSRVEAGSAVVKGRAWGGAGIEEVEIRVDDGQRVSAVLDAVGDPRGWCAWSAVVELAPGSHTVTARARDAESRWQPLQPVVNRLGYGNNTAHAVRVEAVRDRPRRRLPGWPDGEEREPWSRRRAWRSRSSSTTSGTSIERLGTSWSA